MDCKSAALVTSHLASKSSSEGFLLRTRVVQMLVDCPWLALTSLIASARFVGSHSTVPAIPL